MSLLSSVWSFCYDNNAFDSQLKDFRKDQKFRIKDFR